VDIDGDNDEKKVYRESTTTSRWLKHT
jgi:hypothetical protein